MSADQRAATAVIRLNTKV